MSAPIDAILASLTKVRQRQPGQWSARCPAHDDQGPSLSVRENLDGSVLVHCFAGCSIHAVLDSLGLDMADLYPPRQLTGREPKRLSRLLTAGQALELLSNEALLIFCAGSSIVQGLALTPEDLSRVAKATGRIHWLLRQSGHMRGSHA